MENNFKKAEEQLYTHNKKFSIEFRDLCYSVHQRKGRKVTDIHILKNINGKFESGHLTAILGPSGAGKTSLLNILSGFRTTGKTGTILFNEQDQNAAEFKKLSCCITQEFAMLPLLTTQETLMTAADLKIGTSISKFNKISMVNEILELLGLQKSKNTYVGKLSGGEKKRLSIGVELVTNPPVMFFDEPTSGLDSSSSVQVISHLKSLAEAGRTVVCSIHQPSSELFEMFDHLYLIAEGRCLYSGPICDMTTVFEEEGFVCPKYYNRADFAIEIACNKKGSTEKLFMRFNKEFHISDVTSESDDNAAREETLMLQPKVTVQNETTVKISMDNNYTLFHEYSTSSWLQLIILTRRSILCTFRDPYLMHVRFFIHVFVGLVLGALCYDVGNEASKVPSNISCIFFFVLFLFLVSPGLTVLVFPLEAGVFLREHQNNWYTLRAYYFSKIFADLPFQIICPSVFLLASYFLTGQPYDGMRLPHFWILGVLLAACGQTMGFMIGAAFAPQMAICTLLTFNATMVLFSGFLVRLRDVPKYLQWLTNISYYHYSFQGAMVTIFGSKRPNLKCSEIYCHYKVPSKILQDFDMSDSTYEGAIIVIVLWILVLQVLFYSILKWRLYTLQ